MRYLFLSLFLMACTIPPPAGRVIPEPAKIPEVVTWPIKVEPAPKTKKPVHVPPVPVAPEPPVIETEKAPCEVNQDGGRQQVLETLKCLEDKP